MRNFLISLIAFCIATAAQAGGLDRNYWGCELGKATPQFAADTIKAQFKQQFIEPKIDGDDVIVNKIWLKGYQWDVATLHFADGKLQSITLENDRFTLTDTNQMLREMAPIFLGDDYENRSGILRATDASTHIRMAQSEDENGAAKLQIIIQNLEK
ncbi:MAG: hypothetical protein Q4B68_05335 [Bacteroidales bacterium]|nr:hypothetical protein [Bacteroidales bacterium]